MKYCDNYLYTNYKVVLNWIPNYVRCMHLKINKPTFSKFLQGAEYRDLTLSPEGKIKSLSMLRAAVHCMLWSTVMIFFCFPFPFHTLRYRFTCKRLFRRTILRLDSKCKENGYSIQCKTVHLCIIQCTHPDLHLFTCIWKHYTFNWLRYFVALCMSCTMGGTRQGLQTFLRYPWLNKYKTLWKSIEAVM